MCFCICLPGFLTPILVWYPRWTPSRYVSPLWIPKVENNQFCRGFTLFRHIGTVGFPNLADMDLQKSAIVTWQLTPVLIVPTIQMGGLSLVSWFPWDSITCPMWQVLLSPILCVEQSKYHTFMIPPWTTCNLQHVIFHFASSNNLTSSDYKLWPWLLNQTPHNDVGDIMYHSWFHRDITTNPHRGKAVAPSLDIVDAVSYLFPLSPCDGRKIAMQCTTH